MDFHHLSPHERFLVENVLLLNREVRDAGEQATLAAMRKFGKLLLETNLQDRIIAAEAKDAPCEKCSKKK